VDLKSSTVGWKPWHDVQLAAYSKLVCDEPLGRMVLEFKPNNKRRRYHEHWVPQSSFAWDWDVFLAARKIAAWRDLNGK
jgi:hypothetical protein